jgi:hypothetical protein
MFSDAAKNSISGPIGFLANTTYKYATRFHLIPNAGADLEANHAQPVNTRAEAERRRFVLRS